MKPPLSAETITFPMTNAQIKEWVEGRRTLLETLMESDKKFPFDSKLQQITCERITHKMIADLDMLTDRN